MKITIAIDSFKGSLSSVEAGNAAREGIILADPCAEICVCPLADGGEGTVRAITPSLGGELVSTEVVGPLGKALTAEYGIINKRGCAIIEMSSASGITLISESERNPMLTTTYGVGQLIKDAISRGCRSFIIGIGGSATNDGGAGMLEALGFSLLDKNGQIIPRGARGLAELAEIRTDGALKELSECEFSIACDVTNPLLGEHGCSAVFGPQKGADPDTVKEMDALLARYAALSAKITGKDLSSIPGAGAAGGLGFAFITFLGGRLVSGIDLVMQLSSLEEKIKESDIVVTGEGRLDGQSAMGKAPVGVARLAKKHGKRVIALAGAVTESARECNECGIDAFFPILRAPATLEFAMDKKNAYENLKATAEQVFRLLSITA